MAELIEAPLAERRHQASLRGGSIGLFGLVPSDPAAVRPGAVPLRPVTTAAETLLEEALQLPASDRASLAAELLASLDGADDTDVGDVDASWSRETECRAHQLEKGDATLVTWDHLTERITGQRRSPANG